MTERYYTPDIEEFHVGFICEMNTTPNKWVETSITLNHFPHLNKWLLENHIRVKYLDEEDLGSFGFKTMYNVKSDFYKPIYSNEVCRIRTTIDSMITVCISVKNQFYMPEVFRGEIKNESELRKLLKQLGIK